MFSILALKIGSEGEKNSRKKSVTDFGRLWPKKWVQIYIGQEMHYHRVYIAYYFELNLKICDHVQKRENGKNAKTAKTAKT